MGAERGENSVLTGLLFSLALTLILEGAYGLLWRLKSRRDWLLLLLVNVVTNPIVGFLYHVVSARWLFVAALEIAAVLAEWRAYRRWGQDTCPPLLFSLCANCFSFFGGLLLNYFVW